MNVFKYKEATGSDGDEVVKYFLIFNGDFDDSSETTKGYPMEVIARDTTIPTRLKYIPSMMLIGGTKVTIQVAGIGKKVVVLNEKLLIERKVPFFEGMNDVFTIAKRRIGDRIQDI